MRRHLACIVLLLAGCGPKTGNDDTGTTTDTTADTTTGTTADPTVVTTAITGADPTGGGAACPDPNSYLSAGQCFCHVGYAWCDPFNEDDLSCCVPGDTSGGPDPSMPTSDATMGDTSAGDTTGEVQLCVDFCDRLVECGLEGAFDGCPCDPPMGALCIAAWEAATMCFEQASCAALNDGDSPCWTSYEAAVEQCFFGEDGCDVFVQIGGPPDGTCTFGEDCLGQPEKLLHCDDSECSCTIGEQVVGTCPADAVCSNDAIMAAKIAECCA